MQIQRTQRLIKAEQMLSEGDQYRSEASEAEAELKELILNHPELLRMEAFQYGMHTVRSLLLAVPYGTDTFLEKAVVQDLLAKNFGSVGEISTILCTIGLVSVQTFTVASLSLFGKARVGASGLMMRAAGLLTAAAIPVMTVCITLAHGEVSGIKDLKDLTNIQNLVSLFTRGANAAGPSLLDAAKDNAHLLGLAFFSIAAHLAIWVEATDILKAISALAVARAFKNLKAKITRALRKANECDHAAGQYVSTVLEQNQAAARMFGDVEFKPESKDPRVVEMLTRNGHGKE